MSITHEWNGTILTITSDSGTSSADLKGEKGDTGIRGPQGVAGIITDTTGAIELGGYYTKEEINSYNAEKEAEIAEIKEKAIETANALKGSKSGETINLTDISPVEHTVGVKVSSKNILPYPYNNATTGGTENSWVDNGDGTITYSGTNINEGATFYLLGTELNNLLVDGETYTVSLGTDKSFSYPLVVILAYNLETKTNTWFTSQALNSPKVTFTVNKSKYRYDRLYMQVNKGSNNGNAYNVVCKPQLELGTVATAYTPYVDVTTVDIKTAGKNLIDVGYKTDMKTGYTTAGLTFTVNDDNSITVNGTAQYECYPTIAYYTQEAGKTYTLSGTPNGSIDTYHLYTTYRRANENTTLYPDTANGKITFKAGQNRYTAVILKVLKGVVMDNVTIYPQIEVGNTATEYEKYCGTTYTPNTDGTVEGVKSISPVMNIYPNTVGVSVEAEYNRDINKAFAELQQAIISLGGNI